MDVQFNQTVARRGQSWTDEETSILLDIWLNKFQDVTSFDQKNGQIYQEIATEISDLGFRKSAVQCRTRIKTLKRAFKQCNSSRKIGGLMSKLYWKIERAVNLNMKNDLFSSNASDGDAKKVKTEIMSDSDSEHSFQDQDGLFGTADEKSDSLQEMEFERLQMYGSSSKRNRVVNDTSGENPQQSFQTTHETTFQITPYIEKKNQHRLSFNQRQIPAVHEQDGMSGKGPQMGTDIPSSSGGASMCSLNSSVYQMGQHPQRKDGFVGDTDQTTEDCERNGTKSPNSIRAIPEHHESFSNKIFINAYNLGNQKDSRKRSELNCALPSEPHIDRPSKKARFANSNFHCNPDNFCSTNTQLTESHSSEQNQTEQDVFCISSEMNQNESSSKTLFSSVSILETLATLQKTLVTIVSQQTGLTEKLIDTENERLVLRQKELEVELKKQENEKERISMEERQRREDREHHYKVMQLVLGRLSSPSSLPEIQNKLSSTHDDKNT